MIMILAISKTKTKKYGPHVHSSLVQSDIPGRSDVFPGEVLKSPLDSRTDPKQTNGTWLRYFNCTPDAGCSDTFEYVQSIPLRVHIFRLRFCNGHHLRGGCTRQIVNERKILIIIVCLLCVNDYHHYCVYHCNHHHHPHAH